ncbi:SNARE-like superfamily protein [Perilla frutescens var. hirtella]|nr:SNARE-like superfamily protein [Perilla frutescens var. hirtella]
MVKITALMVLKCTPEGADPVILVNASDLSSFGFFQRPSVKEFIVFVGRTVAKRTPPNQRQSVQHEEYKVHSYNRNGLCALGFMDDHYPVRSAFSLLNQVLDEYQKNFGDSWKTAQADNTQQWPYLSEALTKFQDPAEADKLLRIQRELDETKIILHKTIDSVLERGEKLDSLVEKSSDLSAASQWEEEGYLREQDQVTVRMKSLDENAFTISAGRGMGAVAMDVLQAGKEDESVLYYIVNA